MPSPAFYFAWADEDDEFDAAMLRVDEDIVELSFSHSEGDFAAVDVVIRNPKIGLLAPGRKLWVWIAYNTNIADEVDIDNALPVFKGRVVGIPPDLVGETCTVSFLARPSDFEEQKAALAESLRVRPYWDPVWFAPEDALNPDNVLEARNALWHIDPVTHVVSISNITTGEDGTVSADGDIVPYDSVSVSIGAAPTRTINLNLSVDWSQVATGEVNCFPLANFGGGGIFSYTADGLVANWPKTGASLNGGWRVAYGYAEKTGDPDKWIYDYNGTQNVDSDYVAYSWKSGGKGVYVPSTAKYWVAGANVWPSHVLCVRKSLVRGTLRLAFDADRKRSEELYIAVSAQTQAVTTDETDPRIEDMNFSSSEVVSPIDPGGRMPLGWTGANSYLNTDRGARSIEFCLMCARARLIASARCVTFGFEVPFAYGISRYSLRKSGVLEDYRLPGGIAAGKVMSVEWSIDGDSGEATFAVTAGATVGYGGSVEAVDGEPTYAAPGYMAPGYQRVIGQYVIPDSGDLAYQSIVGAEVFDDGIRFNEGGEPFGGCFVQPPRVEFSAPAQEGYIQSGATPEEVYKRLNDSAVTKCVVEMKPVNSGPFKSVWTLATSELQIAKTIDLEAPAT